MHFTDYYTRGVESNNKASTIYSLKLNNVNNIINIGSLPHLKGSTDDSSSTKDYITNDETTDKNFRFVGKNTNNYVKFNDELWRVIGIFNTTGADGKKASRIKIMRNFSLSYNFNQYLSWDTSPSNINNGYGINEWSQADLMKLLNDGYSKNVSYEENITDTKCKTGEIKNDNIPKYYVCLLYTSDAADE